MFGRVGSAPNWKWNDVSMCRLRDLPTKQFHGFEAAVLVHRSNPSGLVIPPMFQLQKYESQEHNPRWRLTFNWNWNLFTAIRFLANPKSTFRSNSCFHTSCSCWLCSSLAYASRAAQQNRILYIYIDIWTLAKYGKVLHSPMTRISYLCNETPMPVHG